MKKLKLLKTTLLNMGDSEVLTRDQLNRILGGDDGSGGSSCTSVVCTPCNSDSDCTYKPGLYCGSSTKCTTVPKVCRRTVQC